MKLTLLLVSVFVITTPLLAQDNIRAFDDLTNNRGSTRILFWNNSKNSAHGELAINYGRPEWKAEYEAAGAFDKMTKGNTWRAGKDFWTTLDTNLPLEIAGQSVAVGAYYLGVHRSEDGDKWSLVLFDQAKTRSQRVDAFEVNKAPVAQKIPLACKMSEEKQSHLLIELVRGEELSTATLKIAWGNHLLTAPVKISI